MQPAPNSLNFEIVVAGGGFAGAYCARTLQRKLGRYSAQKVGLIADENVLVFQPMLAEVVGGSLQPLDVVAPLRQFCKGVNVLQGKIVGIDLENKMVELDAGHFTPNSTVSFNHLVLATGNVVDLSRVPGMSEHGFMLKDAWDAVRLRTGVLERLEEANLSVDPEARRRLLTFVVVGGGYSGVETAGQILDLLGAVKKLYYNLGQTRHRVVLIHSRDYLLPEIGQKLGQYAAEKLKERGMEILLNQRVNSVTSRKVCLANGESIETHMVVSTVGSAPHPLIVGLCEKHNIPQEKGRIKTERSMQVIGHTHLWALGDCAAIPVADQSSCPPTAQFALRQGLQAGANIIRVLRDQPTVPFSHTNQGQLAAIGHKTAVADVMGFKFSGFFAWIIWRSIYLSKLPGIQRQIRVLGDWFMELFFCRETSILRINSRHSIADVHFEKKDLIFQEKDPYLSFYIIKEGIVRCTKSDGTIVDLKSGDLIGGRAFASLTEWTSHAEVLEPATLTSVNRKVIRALSASHIISRLLVTDALREPEETIKA